MRCSRGRTKRAHLLVVIIIIIIIIIITCILICWYVILMSSKKSETHWPERSVSTTPTLQFLIGKLDYHTIIVYSCMDIFIVHVILFNVHNIFSKRIVSSISIQICPTDAIEVCKTYHNIIIIPHHACISNWWSGQRLQLCMMVTQLNCLCTNGFNLAYTPSILRCTATQHTKVQAFPYSLVVI
jgi:magnesium-transporting ATPase (P-type)